MPRIRTLKPEHRQHRKIGPLSDREYRLWVSMICEADDDGRLVADPDQLRVLTWGYHSRVKVCEVSGALETLRAQGLIDLYRFGETVYARFPSWTDHQRISHASPSRLPGPTPGSPPEDSGNLASIHGGSEGKGREEKGRERRSTTAGVPALADDAFFSALRGNPAYRGIDIDAEMGKLDAWLLTPRGRGKRKTRGRVVNWLNRVDRPIGSPNGSAPSRPMFPTREAT